jgi:two-component system, cell cycle response regulator
MTLRARLTAAFLALVLGAALLGAAFLSGTVSAVDHDRSTHRLDLAASAVHRITGSLCRQLQVVATAVALQPAETREAVAADLVGRGLAANVQLRDRDGATVLSAPGEALALPWAECDAPDPDGTTRYAGVAARVVWHDADGAAGEVWAAERLDGDLLARLGEAAGVEVALLGTAGPAAEAARELAGGEVTRSADGQWVRRVDPATGQPLPLVLVTPETAAHDRYLLLSAAVVMAGLLAAALAWWLARSTTRPLTELARAADRIAEGDLSTRVRVRSQDEVGQLAVAFNRMAQRTNAYVHALTASRDQLRGHLAVLGDTLSSTHDLHRILRVILQTALSATGARAGAVVLLDPAGDTLTGQYAEAVGAADAADTERGGAGGITPLTVPLSGSLLGAVTTSGVARRGRLTGDGPAGDGPVGEGPVPHDREPHDREPNCRTYLAAPISAVGGSGSELPPWPAPLAARGVLILYDRLGGDEFDDTDLVTLRTFAAQAAVAVDNVRTHEEAQRLSVTDPLTGLWNYRHLTDTLRREVERASRFGHTLTVLALDLDRFKQVNDVYGHPAGDAVLVEFARRIGSQIREHDYAFRQGGEEFVVLLPETDARGGAIVAQRLGTAVRERPVVITPRGAGGEAPVTVTVSIGIAVYPDHGRTPTALLDAADDALYAAKAAGRDTHRVATPAPAPAAADELAVRVAARTPEGHLPRAGSGDPAGSTPADGGVKPPRQSRGG